MSKRELPYYFSSIRFSNQKVFSAIFQKVAVSVANCPGLFREAKIMAARKLLRLLFQVIIP